MTPPNFSDRCTQAVKIVRIHCSVRAATRTSRSSRLTALGPGPAAATTAAAATAAALGDSFPDGVAGWPPSGFAPGPSPSVIGTPAAASAAWERTHEVKPSRPFETRSWMLRERRANRSRTSASLSSLSFVSKPTWLQRDTSNFCISSRAFSLQPSPLPGGTSSRGRASNKISRPSGPPSTWASAAATSGNLCSLALASTLYASEAGRTL
mmetsp:Transcript_27681/g.73528  ORF Transcript_27681/g.73528 Transcript_27681/m.73528 type:complete len:210 (+) Transcript_27681:640-1269(+)